MNVFLYLSNFLMVMSSLFWMFSKHLYLVFNFVYKVNYFHYAFTCKSTEWFLNNAPLPEIIAPFQSLFPSIFKNIWQNKSKMSFFVCIRVNSDYQNFKNCRKNGLKGDKFVSERAIIYESSWIYASPLSAPPPCPLMSHSVLTALHEVLNTSNQLLFHSHFIGKIIIFIHDPCDKHSSNSQVWSC